MEPTLLLLLHYGPAHGYPLIEQLGEYGLEDLCIGVPVKLGLTGIMKVFELELTDEEMSLLHKAADHTRRDIETLKRLGIAE